MVKEAVLRRSSDECETRFFKLRSSLMTEDDRVPGRFDLSISARLGNCFATTTLAEAVNRAASLSLDDPVAKYVTRVLSGGDVRRITPGRASSHTSVLPTVRGHEQAHKRQIYVGAGFRSVRFL